MIPQQVILEAMEIAFPLILILSLTKFDSFPSDNEKDIDNILLIHNEVFYEEIQDYLQSYSNENDIFLKYLESSENNNIHLAQNMGCNAESLSDSKINEDNIDFDLTIGFKD